MRSPVAKNTYRHLICGAAAIALLTVGGVAMAAEDAGHTKGSSHETSTDHGDQGAKGGKGRAPGESASGGHKGMQDILRDISAAEEEESDRPEWAGVKGGKAGAGGGKPDTAGAAKGDLFGDLYVILRDANGVPILNAQGFVQPIDANGNLIPLDAEGAPIDPTLAQEVELGRLNVGRAPVRVLDRRADEIVTMLTSATAVSLDPAGRLVLTVDGVPQTIDAPLENLAIYVALMTTGSIPGVSDLPGTEFDHLVDGKFTTADLTSAASFLAAASDKAGKLTADEIAYIDAFLGINTVKQGDVTYSAIDYSAFAYDRSDAYSNVTTTVLIKQADGSWMPTTVNVYDVVFGSQDYSGSGTLSAFTQAAEDARAVINYIHEYAVPADSVE